MPTRAAAPARVTAAAWRRAAPDGHQRAGGDTGQGQRQDARAECGAARIGPGCGDDIGDRYRRARGGRRLDGLGQQLGDDGARRGRGQQLRALPGDDDGAVYDPVLDGGAGRGLVGVTVDLEGALALFEPALQLVGAGAAPATPTGRSRGAIRAAGQANAQRLSVTISGTRRTTATAAAVWARAGHRADCRVRFKEKDRSFYGCGHCLPGPDACQEGTFVLDWWPWHAYPRSTSTPAAGRSSPAPRAASPATASTAPRCRTC